MESELFCRVLNILGENIMPKSFVTGVPLDLVEESEQVVDVALRMPTKPKGLGFQLLYGLANAVIGLCNITLATILLPARIATLVAPQQQTNTFIVLSAMGALAAVITNPLVGAWSDRTTLALGRRRPWLIAAIVLLVVSLVELALASSVVLLAIGVVLLQVLRKCAARGTFCYHS